MTFEKLLIDYGGIWGGIYVACFAAVFAIYRNLMDSPDERWSFVIWLTNDAYNQRYRGLMLSALDWIDGALAAREIRTLKVEGPEREAALRRNQDAFGVGLLDFALLTAFFYPFVSILLQWSTWGTEGKMGSLVVIPAQEQVWRRSLVLVALAATAIALRLFFNGLLQHVFVITLNLFRLKIRTTAPIAGVIAVIIAGTFTAIVAAGITDAGAVSVAFAGAFSCVVAFSIAGTFAIALAGLIAIFITALSLIALVLSIFIMGPLGVNITIFYIIIGSSAVIILSFFAGSVFLVAASAHTAETLRRQYSRPALVLIVYVLLLLMGVLFGAAISRSDDFAMHSLLLFLGILPLVNALADYGSIGATRAFLRRGMGNPGWQAPLVWSLIDLGVGILAFYALGCAMILAIQSVIWLGGPALIDLPRLFANSAVTGSLLHDPWAYTWLYFTFLTTLLPTFLHLVLALLSYVTTAPGFMRRAIARWLDQGGQGRKGAGNLGLAALCAAIAAAFTGAAALVWYIGVGLVWAFPQVGPGIVGAFAAWARLIGAI